MRQDPDRVALLRRRVEIEEEIEAVTRQLSSSINEVERLRLQRQWDALKAERRNLDAQIDRFPKQPIQQGKSHEAELHKLDFKKIRQAVADIKTALDANKIGAASFYLENCGEYGGEWCIRLLKELFEKDASEFYEHRIEFGILAPLSLATLCKGLKAITDSAGGGAGELDSLIHSLADRVGAGDVLFLEIAFDQKVLDQREFLQTIMHAFWRPLLDRIAQNAELSLVKVVLVLTIIKPLYKKKKLLRKLTEPKHACDLHGLVPLQLERWTREEVLAWLRGPAKMGWLGAEGTEQLAGNCWEPGWAPATVASRLLYELSRLTRNR